MAKKMYIATEWRQSIEQIEVERVTEKTYWQIGYKNGSRLITSNRAVFATWDDAHEWLVNAHLENCEQARRHIERANLSLKRAKGALGNVKGMKNPYDVEVE